MPDILGAKNNNACTLRLDNRSIKEKISTKYIYTHLIDKHKTNPPTSQNR